MGYFVIKFLIDISLRFFFNFEETVTGGDCNSHHEEIKVLVWPLKCSLKSNLQFF